MKAKRKVRGSRVSWEKRLFIAPGLFLEIVGLRRTGVLMERSLLRDFLPTTFSLVLFSEPQ